MKKGMTSEQLFLISVCVYTVSAIIRIIKLLIDPLLLRDSAKYLLLVKTWYETQEYDQTLKEGDLIPPLPLHITKLFLKTGLNLEVCGRSITIIWGSLIPVLGVLFAYKLTRKKSISIIMGFLLAINPNLIEYSIQPLRESYYLVFILVVFCMTINIAKTESTKDLILCGFFLSAAFFCRYEAIELFPIVPAILIYKHFKKRITIPRMAKDISLHIGAIAFSFFVFGCCFDTNYVFLSKLLLYFRKSPFLLFHET